MSSALLRYIDQRPMACMRWVTALMVLFTAGRYVQGPPRLTDDQTTNWWPVVNNLLDGKGFTQCLPEYFPFCTDDSPSAMREPLPLLAHAVIAAVSGRSLWAASLFQAILNIVAAWLLYNLGRHLLSDRAGVLAATLWALYLPAYQDVINIAGDQLAAVLLLLAALRFERATVTGAMRDLLFAGILFGLASLCRSAVIAFGAAAGLALVLAHGINGIRRQVLPALVFGTGILLALLPWAARNAMMFDRIVIGSTLSGYNLFRHNTPVKNGQYCHFVASDEGQRYLDSLIAAHPELTGRENEAEMNALYGAAGKEVIARHPRRYIILSAYRLLPLWTNWGVNEAYGKRTDLLDRAVMALQILLLIGAVAGASTAFRGRWPIVVGVGLYCAMYACVVARLRFMIPAMPLVLLLVASAMDRWSFRRTV